MKTGDKIVKTLNAATVLQVNSMAFDNVSVNKDTIKIYLDNKDSIMLINNLSEGEGKAAYFYLGYWPKIKYHKYYPKLYESNGDHFLINNRDGRRYCFTESEPKYNNELNPKGDRDFIASVKDDYHGLSEIKIYEVTDSLKLVYTEEAKPYGCYYFYDLQWHSPTSFFVKKVYNSNSPLKKYVCETIEFRNNKWVHQEEKLFKENCVKDSTK